MNLLVTLTLLLPLACADPFAPPGAIRSDPPLNAAALWAKAEACSGLSGDWRRVRWFALPETHFTGPDGREHGGWWSAPHNIYVGTPVTQQQTDALIEHEMLHDLTQSGAHGPVFAACGV